MTKNQKSSFRDTKSALHGGDSEKTRETAAPALCSLMSEYLPFQSP